jgi:hypothetical protein
MKKQILIAAIAPTFWICFAICMVGQPVKTPDYQYEQGGIVIAAALMGVPCAVIAYLCGKNSKDE